MRKKLFLVLLSLCLLFSFSVVSYAADDDLLVSDEASFDDASEAINQQYVDYVSELAGENLISGSEVALLDLENGSFVPDLFVSGNELPYGQVFSLAMNRVSFSQNVVFQTSSTTDLSAYSLSQINFSDYTYTIEGFENDSTYNGVVYFQVFIPSESYYVFNPAPGYSYSTEAPLNILSPIFPTSMTCYDSSGERCTVYYSYSSTSYDSRSGMLFTFYILLQDYYIPPSNGVVDVNKLVLNVTWSSPSCKRYYLARTDGGVSTPLSYYRVYNPYVSYLSRSYSGTVELGRHTFNSDVEQELQDQLVNGYENDSGAASIETGAASVESGVSVEHDALGSAGSMAETFDYSGGDLTELAAAFSLISGWFTSLVVALGSWNMLIYVSLTMVVALFAVGYFRNK